jgi:hypothetical protein
MQHSSQPIQVLNIEENNGQTFLTVGLDAPKEAIIKYKTDEGLFAIIKFFDSRRITADQRKKIFATIKDIAEYQGELKELIRADLTSSYCEDSGQDYFSLSECSLEIARDFTNYLIEYVLENDIPLTALAIDRTEDINRYLFCCIKYEKCCICGKKAIVYKLNDNNKMALCDEHHDIARTKGLREFEKVWKVYGIKCLR